MANLTPTASQVTGATANTASLYCAAAINAGQAVYKDANGLWALADANLVIATRTTFGIALATGAAGQKIEVATEGEVTLGAAAGLVTAMVYVVSATLGAICPYADLVTNDYLYFLGAGIGSNKIYVHPWIFGVQKP